MDIKLIEEFLKTRCPIVEEDKIKAIYFGGTESRYTVKPVMTEPVVKRYTDGGRMEQFVFLLTAETPFSSCRACKKPGNELFCAFSAWAATMRDGALGGNRLLRAEVLNGGFLYEDKECVKYRIQCRILFLRPCRSFTQCAVVKRNEKVAFYGHAGNGKYQRMEEFTQLYYQRNPKLEYMQGAKVTGYAPSLSYCFEQYRDNQVHSDIVALHDGEATDGKAVREIVFVDHTQPVGTKQFRAYLRSFTVAPEAEGEALRACRYSGTFYANGPVVRGTAATADDWKSCRFLKEKE